MGVDGEAETGAELAAAGEAGDSRRERRAIGRRISRGRPSRSGPDLCADHEIIDDPGVALAVEHGFAAGAFKPPPANLSGKTQALGAKLRYGMKGTGRSTSLPAATG